MPELFRGLVLDSKKSDHIWEYGGVNKDKTCIVRHSLFTPVYPETVCEFTGVYDNTETPLYTGDIVETFDEKTATVVKAMCSTMGFYLLDENKTYRPLYGEEKHGKYIANVKIIGTIF